MVSQPLGPSLQAGHDQGLTWPLSVGVFAVCLKENFGINPSGFFSIQETNANNDI